MEGATVDEARPQLQHLSIRCGLPTWRAFPGARGRGFDPPAWARRRVGEAIELLGGQGSLVASCLWHVIGLEWSMRRWCGEQAGVARSTGAGILVAALVILAAKGSRPAA